uniref:Vesicle transport v-SNARE N-terminal domain-containing protein n=1 Tax=Palpitomonas bilix TaxID=652834 RepID=A0A7S3CXB5_9EUKA|mmetsp:Transcript_13224/g.34667  ORF Transcript_13224/g.34667 Transcript_13224/m.34667 type:complete len:242 (+) Transcript_13224:240-965(+)
MAMLFDGYVADFDTIVRHVVVKLNDVINGVTTANEEKREIVAEAEKELKDATSMCREAAIASKELRGPKKERGAERVAKMRKELEEAKSLLTRAQRQRASDLDPEAREQLFAGATPDDVKARLLSNTDRLHNATASIERSKRLAAENERIGMNVMRDLHSQKETLLRTRDNLAQADVNIDQSSKVLSRIARRIMTNKLLLGFIILIILAIIGVIIYLIITKTSAPAPSPTPSPSPSHRLLL